MTDILDNAPAWWASGNKEIYDNLIFLFPSITIENFLNSIGKPKDELEKVQCYKKIFFWSFNLKDYQHTNWWSKTASLPIKDHITIRTANTVKKLATL